jgi:hypothetical protein
MEKKEKKQRGSGEGSQRIEGVSGTITYSQDREKKKNLSVEANVNFGQREKEQQPQQQQQQGGGLGLYGEQGQQQLHYGKQFGHIETRKQQDLKLKGGKLGFGFIVSFMAELDRDPSYLAGVFVCLFEVFFWLSVCFLDGKFFFCISSLSLFSIDCLSLSSA